MTVSPLLNQPAPDFTLFDHESNDVSLAKLRGRPVLLVFYPGDDTPGCTAQLCAIRDDWSAFQSFRLAAYGVNPGSAQSHEKFWRHHGLKTPLLVDTDRRVAKAYGATKTFFGAEIIQRTVVLIDAAGIIRQYWRGMPSVATMLSALQELA